MFVVHPIANFDRPVNRPANDGDDYWEWQTGSLANGRWPE
jgi:hypothetical protein